MRRILTISLLVAMVLGSMGCSKSDSNNNTDPGASEAAALAGDQSLVDGDFVAADGHYQDALTKDASNGHANLGAAITGLAMLQADPGVDSLLTFLAEKPVVPPTRATRPSRLLARLALSTRLSYDPLSNGRGLARLLLRAAEDPIMASWYQSVVKNRIMPRLQYVEDRMNVIEANPTFTYMVPTAISGATVPLEVDLGEVLAIDAMVNSIQGVLGILVAYNFDALPDAMPEDLMASTTFGTLHTGGAAELTAARANLLLAITRLGAMESFINAEGDDQSDDVIPAEALADPDFVGLKAGYASVQLGLTSTVTEDVTAYDGSVKQVDFALGVFFTDPIMDWKEYVPEHTFDLTGKIVVTDPINFPLPTFHGIFPNMDNTQWQAIIGPVNPPAVANR